MRSLYKRQFILTAGMILGSFALLGAAFFTPSFHYTIPPTTGSMERHADPVGNLHSQAPAFGGGGGGCGGR